MLSIPAALGRKILCLSIIFNSIISILLTGNILYMFYVNKSLWRPYWPFLLDGSLLWFVIITSFLNIVTAKILGNVDLRRIKFHHYFYGLLASLTSFIFLVIFAPTYLFALLMPMLIPDVYSSASMPVFTIFFFVYGGMTLMIDDIQDMSLRLRRFLNNLKGKLKRVGGIIGTLHFCCSVASIYVMLSILPWTFANGLSGRPAFYSLSAEIFALNLLITSLWGLVMAKKRVWLKNFYIHSKLKSCHSPQ